MALVSVESFAARHLEEARAEGEGRLAITLGGVLSRGSDLGVHDMVNDVNNTVLDEDIVAKDACILDEVSSLLVDLDFLVSQGLEGCAVLECRGVGDLVGNDVVLEHGSHVGLAEAIDRLLNLSECFVVWREDGDLVEALNFFQQASAAKSRNEVGGICGSVVQLVSGTARKIEHVVDGIDDTALELHERRGLGEQTSARDEGGLKGTGVEASHNNLAAWDSGPWRLLDSSLVWGERSGQVGVDAIEDMVSKDGL